MEPIARGAGEKKDDSPRRLTVDLASDPSTQQKVQLAGIGGDRRGRSRCDETPAVGLAHCEQRRSPLPHDPRPACPPHSGAAATLATTMDQADARLRPAE